jgi:hypothetical protein
MTNLVRTPNGVIHTQAISRKLVEHIDQMEMCTEIAKCAIEEISEIYAYSEFKVVNSLVATDLYRNSYEQSGGKLTMAEARAYTALRQTYLDQMANISAIATSQIVQDVAEAPRRGGKRPFWNRTSGE